MNEEYEKFWCEREERFGGKPGFKCFSTYIGGSRGRLKNLTGLLYHIGDYLVFEDFEKSPGALAMLFNKSRPSYTKFIFDMELTSITEINRETVKRALRRINRDDAALPSAGRWGLFFSPFIMEVVTGIDAAEERTRHYFEIPDKRSLRSFNAILDAFREKRADRSPPDQD